MVFIIVAYVFVPVVLALGVRKYRELQWGTCKDFRSLEGKVFIVTGANSGIGKETVKGLAERKARVILACRNIDSANAAISEIRKSISTGELIPMTLDLASLKSVTRFAGNVLRDFPRIHTLINNAGVNVPVSKGEKTEDGFEIHFGVNHLGHFHLTNLLLETVINSAPSRIVIVSSLLHERGTIDFDNLNGEKGFVGGMNPAYCNSKLANAYYCVELAKRLAPRRLDTDVVAVCPGFCYTNIFRYSNLKWWKYLLFLPIAFFYMRSAKQGAQNVLHCALSEEVRGKSGEFFRDCKPYKSKHNFDPNVSRALWNASGQMIMK
ncbi:retinol dehydrogenase 11 [Nilaparvata lugens]|uniref:retinol dehydrogenase 11 n=1 Tax=Nilaparvata lugens TaxID=108931 RepID=UPI000B9976A6|nr:retinol dehydrogenase 11 [Nilaparvata lugens]